MVIMGDLGVLCVLLIYFFFCRTVPVLWLPEMISVNGRPLRVLYTYIDIRYIVVQCTFIQFCMVEWNFIRVMGHLILETLN